MTPTLRPDARRPNVFVRCWRAATFKGKVALVCGAGLGIAALSVVGIALASAPAPVLIVLGGGAFLFFGIGGACMLLEEFVHPSTEDRVTSTTESKMFKGVIRRIF